MMASLPDEWLVDLNFTRPKIISQSGRIQFSFMGSKWDLDVKILHMQKVPFQYTVCYQEDQMVRM